MTAAWRPLIGFPDPGDPVTGRGYAYRGRDRNLGLNLAAANEQIMADRPARSAGPIGQDVVPAHGTPARFAWDRSQGRRPCAKCRRANRDAL